MLTLLHIIESLADFGGTPRKLLYLSRHLDAAQCRQIFLCYLPSPLKAEFERYGAVVECLDSASPVAIIRGAIRLAHAYEADAICTHFTRPLVTGYVAAKAAGLPVIHNEHCSANYQRGLGRIISKLMLPRVQSITCNSNYTLNSVRQAYALPSERLVTIHNPVEKRECATTHHDIRKALGFSVDELVIGHVGGMIPQRDQATLIRAFARVRLDHPDSRLVLIGDGRIRADLESLAARHQLTSSVVFTGYTDKIGAYLDAIDVYVNPTLDEGFGIAVVEAMLSGIPVVLSDKGAHPELIEDGVSGMLYRGGDSNSLAEVLCLLAKNSTLKGRMGEAARLRAVKFHPKRYAEAYFRNAQKIAASYKMSQASWVG